MIWFNRFFLLLIKQFCTMRNIGRDARTQSIFNDNLIIQFAHFFGIRIPLSYLDNYKNLQDATARCHA